MSGVTPGPEAVIGVFARTFPRDSASAVADAVRAAGFTTVQLNLSSTGLPTVPDEQTLDGLDLAAIGRAFGERGIDVWGVSATFNLIGPDAGRRRRETADAARFLGRVGELGAGFATLCTGTRDPENMWRAHPDNSSPAAWADLRAGLDVLVPAARAGGVRLGVEPEPGNVVADAVAAARLFAELGPDAATLAVVLDPANLLTPATAADQRTILGDAVEQLGDQVACLHAKDVVASGYAAAGTGLLDYDLVFDLWSRLPAPVPVIAQDSTEEDAPRVHALLADHAARHPWRGPGT